ncbi:MAG: M20/M25/M40 family metallo-hydrolase, partial [Oligoflexales bacterium]|nr:M20/M25/M40 family metallo-hydrolase [Oligoflexales bacterium]
IECAITGQNCTKINHQWVGHLFGVTLYPRGHKNKQSISVILSAHYDHNGVYCRLSEKATSNQYCNGAADNAASVAAVLNAAKILKESIKSPVFIALWDGEEIGLKGSKYFVENPVVNLNHAKLLLNLDILGLNFFDFEAAKKWHFVIGSESGGRKLKKDIEASFKDSGIQRIQLSYVFGEQRSDMTSFVNSKLKIPFIFFSDGDGSVYHSTADEVKYINFEKVNTVSEVVASIATKASQQDTKYSYHNPKGILGTPYIRLADVRNLAALFNVLVDNLNYVTLKEAEKSFVLRASERINKLAKNRLFLSIGEQKEVGEFIQGLTRISRDHFHRQALPKFL